MLEGNFTKILTQQGSRLTVFFDCVSVRLRRQKRLFFSRRANILWCSLTSGGVGFCGSAARFIASTAHAVIDVSLRRAASSIRRRSVGVSLIWSSSDRFSQFAALRQKRPVSGSRG